VVRMIKYSSTGRVTGRGFGYIWEEIHCLSNAPVVYPVRTVPSSAAIFKDAFTES
jgi:hypothetical protein